MFIISVALVLCISKCIAVEMLVRTFTLRFQIYIFWSFDLIQPVMHDDMKINSNVNANIGLGSVTCVPLRLTSGLPTKKKLTPSFLGSPIFGTKMKNIGKS